MSAPLKARKPNIRRLFIPDPGWVIVDADISGADAGVVAWETNDPDLKDVFLKGKRLHEETATLFFGKRFSTAPGDPKNKLSPKGHLYDDVKRATHALNYGASPRTIAITLGWPVSEGQRFAHFWFSQHPGVKAWQDRVEMSLRTTRTVSNAFGYRVPFFERVDGLLPEALAWIPQSTVALNTFYGARNVDRVYVPVPRRPRHPDNRLVWLLQVHDSLVFQIRQSDLSILGDISRLLLVPIPYPEPLTLPWKLSVSSVSWGDCAPYTP